MLKNRLCYVLLLLCTSVFFICYNGYLSLYVFALSLLFPVLAFFFSLPGMLGARVTLGYEDRDAGAVRGARKGEAVPLRIRVWNATPCISGRIRARLTVENTLTGQREEEHFTFTASSHPQVLEHQLSSPTCGQVVCRLDKLWVSDYLGIFSLPLGRRRRQEAAVFFWPSVAGVDLAVQEGNMPDAQGERYSQRKPGDDPTELFALREYREGDRLSRIHWKLSQKMGKPLVKELGLPIADHLFFLLDLNGTGVEADTLLDAFATLSHFLAERETAHRVGYWDTRGNRLRCLEISQPEDLLPVWREILSSQGLAPLPALEGEALPAVVSHCLYLCCMPQPSLLGALRAQYPAARLSVLQAAESWTTARESRSDTLGGEAQLTVLRPGRIAENLNGFLL